MNPKPNIPEPVRNEPLPILPQEDLERQIMAEFRPVLSADEIEKNNAALSRIAEEEERKKQEFIEAESQKVRDLMLDYIQYPHKYTAKELRVIYAGGFEVDFAPLIDAVNKCPGVSLRKEDNDLYGVRQLYSDRNGRKESIATTD